MAEKICSLGSRRCSFSPHRPTLLPYKSRRATSTTGRRSAPRAMTFAVAHAGPEGAMATRAYAGATATSRTMAAAAE